MYPRCAYHIVKTIPHAVRCLALVACRQRVGSGPGAAPGQRGGASLQRGRVQPSLLQQCSRRPAAAAPSRTRARPLSLVRLFLAVSRCVLLSLAASRSLSLSLSLQSLSLTHPHTHTHTHTHVRPPGRQRSRLRGPCSGSAAASARPPWVRTTTPCSWKHVATQARQYTWLRGRHGCNHSRAHGR